MNAKSIGRGAVVLYLGLFGTVQSIAQQRPFVISPEVQPDHRVSFRLYAPTATKVEASIESLGKPIPMQKDEQGIWTVTTSPLEPDFYSYTYLVDGASVLDPVNPLIKPNILNPGSMVHVTGPTPVFWDVNNIPRGAIHRHFYHSAVAGDDREYHVYTPPNYDPRAKRPYPVLYLLHGYSDDATAWVVLGRANVILDNLIEQGKARPMVIVMPLGYGTMEFVKPVAVWGSVFRDEGLRKRNFEGFRDALLNEVMPAVEGAYRVSHERRGRAIAGLSMGGAESLFVGLNHLDRFGWIGAFSHGGLDEDLDKQFPGLDARAGAQLGLLWVSCGKDDFLIKANHHLRDWLQTKQVPVKWLETEGAHTWQVWRRNLTDFAALLFQQPAR